MCRLNIGSMVLGFHKWVILGRMHNHVQPFEKMGTAKADSQDANLGLKSIHAVDADPRWLLLRSVAKNCQIKER
jgi:hypothetical protein